MANPRALPRTPEVGPVYEEYDDVAGGTDPNNPGTNQLVETVSHDGVNFKPLLNEGLTSDPSCAGGGALNCVTNDAGIPGNQVLSGTGSGVVSNASDSRRLAATGLDAAVPAAGLLVLLLAALTYRRRHS